MIKRYIRPLSPLERYSLVLNRLYRYHVDGILEGQGDVDPTALQKAVDQAAQANPAIRVRLRGMLRWTWWVDSGIAPKVFKLPLCDWDGQSELHTEFLQTRLDPMKGQAVADVLIVPCTDGFTRIVFRSVHAAIDGRGLMHWVAEVCRAMRSEKTCMGRSSRLTDLEVQAAHQDQRGTRSQSKTCALHSGDCTGYCNALAGLSYVWRRVVLPSNVNQLLLPRRLIFLPVMPAAANLVKSASPSRWTTVGLRTAEMGIGNLTGYLRLASGRRNQHRRKLMHQIATKVKAHVDCQEFPRYQDPALVACVVHAAQTGAAGGCNSSHRVTGLAQWRAGVDGLSEFRVCIVFPDLQQITCTAFPVQSAS